jgi:hypothetical protein
VPGTCLLSGLLVGGSPTPPVGLLNGCRFKMVLLAPALRAGTDLTSPAASPALTAWFGFWESLTGGLRNEHGLVAVILFGYAVFG